MRREITNFNETMERVMTGESNLLMATYTKAMRIKAKHIEAWKASGKDFIKQEGSGYRMRSGRGSVFVFAQNLFEEKEY